MKWIIKNSKVYWKSEENLIKLLPNLYLCQLGPGDRSTPLKDFKPNSVPLRGHRSPAATIVSSGVAFSCIHWPITYYNELDAGKFLTSFDDVLTRIEPPRRSNLRCPAKAKVALDLELSVQ